MPLSSYHGPGPCCWGAGRGPAWKMSQRTKLHNSVQTCTAFGVQLTNTFITDGWKIKIKHLNAMSEIYFRKECFKVAD